MNPTTTHHPYELAVRITCLDRAIIRQHFAEHRAGQGEEPTRATYGSWLHYARLPSRLQTKRLPCKLELKLSALTAGYQRVLVDGDVLLIETGTRRFVDAMHNASAGHGADTGRQSHTDTMLHAGLVS